MELAKFETIVNRINENGLYGKDANEYLELIVEFVGPVSGDELSQFVENVRDPKRENCHNCVNRVNHENKLILIALFSLCLLYTSDAADERSSVDLGGRRIIKKKQHLDKVDKAIRLSLIHISEPTRPY